MQKSIYNIPEMDCPSEENLIRMKLDEVDGIRQLQFDIENRRLFIFHFGENSEITQKLESLKLGADLVKTGEVSEDEAGKSYGKTFALGMGLNVIFIAVEINYYF
ncbi:MAG: hypothetical protein U5K32_13275 [Bacteroidales bacterium]|nr:hypothetical protein [Bacteroidales bacterium]